MNQDKLKKMQDSVRIGGKGSVRRKRKVVRKSFVSDEKKLQTCLKKIAVNNISGIEEVNMIKQNGSVIHFNNPKVQASLSANTFSISGSNETKQIAEMLPGILNHLGSDGFNQLKRIASSVNSTNPGSSGLYEDDEDVPELVEDFEAASKNEDKPTTPSDEKPSESEDVTMETAKEEDEAEDADADDEGDDDEAKTDSKKKKRSKKEAKEVVSESDEAKVSENEKPDTAAEGEAKDISTD